MITSHRIAPTPTVEDDAPEPDHGDTEAKPSPAPSARNTSERAAMTRAPATTAAHEMPDSCASFDSGADSGGGTSRRLDIERSIECFISTPLSFPAHGRKPVLMNPSPLERGIHQNIFPYRRRTSTDRTSPSRKSTLQEKLNESE